MEIRPRVMRTRGFTLLELLVVLVITGILAATVVVFFKPAISSYFDAKRRASLTDMADTALRRMGRDVRSAVPNSVRIPNNQCFEIVPTSGGGRYRTAPNTVSDDAGPTCTPTHSCPLDITQPVLQFDSLSQLPVTPAVNDWVVIGNQNSNDVYAGTTSAAFSSISTPNAAFGLHRISLQALKQFPSGYTGGRFVIVPNNGGNPSVFYVCSGAGGPDAQGNGTGTLFRLTRAFNAAYPAACPAGGDILATRVRSCNFIYDPNQGATQQSGFVWMQLELTEANETVSISYGAHVDNVP